MNSTQLYVSLLLLGPGLAFCSQSELTSQDQVELVETVVNSGAIVGIQMKQLGRMGDQVADALEALMEEERLTPNQMSRALMCVRLAFDSPRSVDSASARPIKTLALLHSMKRRTKDSKTLAAISRTREQVVSRTAKYGVRGHKPG